MQGLTRDQLPTFRRRASPHRRLVRVVGSGLVVAGLVVAGFAGYEVWVTGLIARHAQHGLAASLEARAGTVVARPVGYDPASLPEAPIALPEEIVAPEGGRMAPIPATPASRRDVDSAVAHGSGAVALDTLPGEDLVSPGESVSVLAEPAPGGGEALGRIVIPAASVDWTIVEGVAPADLRLGAGHMPGSALPGEPGNTVISGHRTTYGAPFAHLDRLGPGDVITVETATAVHTYAVVETRVVGPADVWVTGQWRGAWLTLTTCHPRHSSAQRLVVFAHLVDGPNAGVILASH